MRKSFQAQCLAFAHVFVMAAQLATAAQPSHASLTDQAQAPTPGKKDCCSKVSSRAATPRGCLDRAR